MRFNNCKAYSKILLLFVVLLILMSAVRAENAYYGDTYYQSYNGPSEGFINTIFNIFGDSIKDIITGIPELFLKLLLKVFNAPISILIDTITKLLAEPVQTSIFYSMWGIIVASMSFLFTSILVFCGFSFMTSGHDVQKRENAKKWLTQTIILIIVIPMSYFVYDLILEIAAGMTKLVLSHVSYNFLIVGQGSLGDLFLELFFAIPYASILLLTAILLLVRFAIVGCGVMIFPIGVLLYFVPPTKEYGELIINFLLVNIFSSIFIAIIILTFSLIAQTGFLSNLQILIAIATFMLVNLFLSYVMFFAAIKAAFNVGTKVAGVVKYLL